MNRRFPAIALFVVFATIACVTSPPVKAQNPPSSTASAKDYSPNTWNEYFFPAAHFRIRFPEKPQETIRTEGPHQVHSLQYKGVIVYRITYVDYKGRIDDPQKVKETLRTIKSAALDAIRDRDVRVLAEREVDVDGHAGVFVHMQVRATEIHRVQWVIAGSRLYIISVEARKESSEQVEVKDDFEKVATEFIRSFHITP